MPEALTSFATISDLQTMWRAMTVTEQSKATYVLKAVSDRLRYYGEMVGKDLDAEATASATYASVLKSVTCDIAVRAMTADQSTADMTQYSQSAMGYVVSGTFANPGGGIYIKNAELKMLGLRRQRAGAMEYDFT